jgi:hypothetical protein
MTELVLIAAVLLPIYATLGVCMVHYGQVMVDEVNSRLPESDQFSHDWWYFTKVLRLWRSHFKFFPRSRTRKLTYLFTGLLFLFVIPYLYVVFLILKRAEVAP